MAKEEVQLSPSDRKRLEALLREIQQRAREITSIKLRAIADKHPASVEHMRGKPVIEFSIKAKHSGPGQNMDVLAEAGDPGKMGTVASECFGSGPGMCLCYNYWDGICSVC